MTARVEVVEGSGEKAAPGQPFGGQPVFDIPGTHVGLTRLAPGAVTPWHHHCDCNFFGYVIRGAVTLQFGPGGLESEQVPAGRFLRIPPRLIHRDLNETHETTLIATWCVGQGPRSAAVDGPEP